MLASRNGQGRLAAGSSCSIVGAVAEDRCRSRGHHVEGQGWSRGGSGGCGRKAWMVFSTLSCLLCSFGVCCYMLLCVRRTHAVFVCVASPPLVSPLTTVCRS
jgi:hypothetical protein